MQPVTREEVVHQCSTSSTSSGGSAGRWAGRAARAARWLSAHAPEIVTGVVLAGLLVACYRTLDAWTRYGAW